MFPVRIALVPLVPDAIRRAAAARAGTGAVADPPPWKVRAAALHASHAAPMALSPGTPCTRVRYPP